MSTTSTTGEIASGFNGNGPAILAVDILPSELPLEASEEFAKALAPILPALARADFSRPFDALEISGRNRPRGHRPPGRADAGFRLSRHLDG